MKFNRSENAVRNIFFGILMKVYQIVVPFIMRTIVIYFMGMEYLGLNSLFASVLQSLNLMELGIDSAIAFGMYRPIVEDDQAMICGLMKLYRRNYRIVGAIIAVLGVVMLPFVPQMIKRDMPPELNVYVLYFLYLAATVLSYWLFAYKNCLLNAHQRDDVIHKITIVVSTAQYILQAVVLLVFRNYYLYLLIALANQIVTNLWCAAAVSKRYPQYKAGGELPRETAREFTTRTRDLFVVKIGGVLVNSADSVAISAFLGLTMLAIYQNYYYILSSIIGLVTVVFNACTAGIGNSLIVETKEKNFRDLKKFTFMICWLAGFCTCSLLCLYQPFVKIWTGEENLLGFATVILICAYYFVFEIGQLLSTFKDAAGIWHEDRFRPLMTAAANLILNLILVRFWGIFGIVLATVLATALVSVVWLLRNLFSLLFQPEQLWPFLGDLAWYVAVIVLACAVTYGLCSLLHLGDVMTLLARGCLCALVPNALFLLAYRKRSEFTQCVQMAKNVLLRKR